MNPLLRSESGRAIHRWVICAPLLALCVASCLCATSQPPPAPPTAPGPVVGRTEALAGVWLFEMTQGGQSIQYSLHFSVTNGIIAGG
jgi:uncharacterized lipoprotein YddW (UPF0748 family)